MRQYAKCIDMSIVMRIAARLRLWPLIATLVLVCIGCALGQWQTRRAEQKEALFQAIEKASASPLISLNKRSADNAFVSFQRLVVEGEFVQDWPLYLDNRPLHGRAGFYVLMPFRVAGTHKLILIARGWQMRNSLDRAKLPVLKTPSGQITLNGMVRDQLDRVMQLGQSEKVKPGSIIQNLDLADIAAQTGMAFYPFVLEQTSELPDDLQRDWPLPSSGAEKHRAYAFQWYGLAAMALIFFLVTGFRRGKK